MVGERAWGRRVMMGGGGCGCKSRQEGGGGLLKHMVGQRGRRWRRGLEAKERAG